jgi:hypothetical protein
MNSNKISKFSLDSNAKVCIIIWMDNPYGENKMQYVIEWESRVWSHP